MCFFFAFCDCISSACFVNVQISFNDNANPELGHGNTLGTSSGEVLDNKEIDETLDEFSKMLSDYSCDVNPTDPAAPSAAQTRLESLFVPPDRTGNPSQPSPARSCQFNTQLPDSVTSAAEENPGASVGDEASIR